MAQSEWLPWRDYHEDLQKQRLITIANVFRKVWRRCSELHEPTAGDGSWCLSCRAFQRCVHELTQAQQDLSWLSLRQERALQYVIGIGLIPVRFYHGDADEMNTNYTVSTEIEKAMRRPLLRLHQNIREGVSLRFATDTDGNGVPQAVTLVEYHEQLKTALNHFEIPEATEGAPVIRFPQSPLLPGVIQPRPAVRPRSGKAQGQVDDDEKR
jgi:hypothetical protein